MQTKRSVSVRESSEHPSETVRQIRRDGIAVQITDRGKVIARLIPVRESKAASKGTSAI